MRMGALPTRAQRGWRVAAIVAAAAAGVAAPAPYAAAQPAPTDAPPPAGDAPQPDAPGPDLSVVGDAVARLAAETRARAFAALDRKDYPAALVALREAHELDARDVQVIEKLAFLHGLLGAHAEAEQLLRQALEVEPGRAALCSALAESLLLGPPDPARLAEAVSLASKARQLAGNRIDVITLQARAARAAGQLDEAERHYRQAAALEPKSAALAIALGDLLRDRGRDELAFEQYRRVPKGDPAFEQAARRAFELEVEREARRFDLAPASEGVSKRAVELYERARQLQAAGQRQEAEQSVNEALRVAPGYGLARVELARLQAARGDEDAAERSYLLVLALDSGRIEAYAGLVELYLASPGAGHAAQAALLAERALGQRPDRGELELLAARAHKAAGDMARALEHVNRFLERVGAGAGTGADPGQAEALRLQRELGELIGAHGDAAEPAAQDSVVPERVAKALQVARAHLARGQTDSALAVLARIEGAELLPEVLNLKAAILAAAGRFDEARGLLLQSLEMDSRQADARLRLADLLTRLGRAAAARAELVQAERLGSAEARLELARLDAVDADAGVFADAQRVLPLWHARMRLDDLLDASSEPGLRAAALALRQQVQDRLLRLLLSLLAASAAGLGLLWVVRERRHGGLSLAEWIEQEPEAGPEIQRTLSALRHEVLKHNTLLLRGLVDVLRSGEPVGDRGRHAVRVLFGDGSAAGASERLQGYAEQLRQLGRSRGVRLNLERRDAALSALLGGFAELARIQGALQACEHASRSARLRLAARLEQALDRILEEGAGQLDALLDQVRWLSVDAARVQAVFERVRREPALVGAAIAPLVVDPAAALPCTLELPGPAFDDVLGNLIRNALQASLHDGAAQPVEVGVHVERRLDPVTGVEQAAFLVRDKSSQPLDAQALQGAYIERGLGLTADLAARHDGTLELVTGEPGWSKAVALVLPCVEGGEEPS